MCDALQDDQGEDGDDEGSARPVRSVLVTSDFAGGIRYFDLSLNLLRVIPTGGADTPGNTCGGQAGHLDCSGQVHVHVLLR
jgi:myo-inositol-hexaphosphate 3-phosphohydrolase